MAINFLNCVINRKKRTDLECCPSYKFNCTYTEFIVCWSNEDYIRHSSPNVSVREIDFQI